jgi:sugar/nucleoside kinase (ribokinase family)
MTKSPPDEGHLPRPLDLLVVGDCNPDLIILGDDVDPVFGQHEKLVSSAQLVVGGSATITAMAAARLGLNVALVAAIGDDLFGNYLRNELTERGVGTDGLVAAPGVPTGVTVALSRGQDRAILTATGAMDTLSVNDVPSRLLTRARHLHVSSYFLQPRLAAGLPALFAQARAAGVTTSLDTNWDPAGRWRDGQLRAVLACTDVFLPNREEAVRISGRPSLESALPALLDLTPRVVVKLGSEGAIAAERGAIYRARPRPVSPVDSTGAGDSFNGGFLTGMLSGLDVGGALSLGCAVGALSTLGAGGVDAHPDRTAAEAMAATVIIDSGPDSMAHETPATS